MRWVRRLIEYIFCARLALCLGVENGPLAMQRSISTVSLFARTGFVCLDEMKTYRIPLRSLSEQV